MILSEKRQRKLARYAGIALGWDRFLFECVVFPYTKDWHCSQLAAQYRVQLEARCRLGYPGISGFRVEPGTGPVVATLSYESAPDLTEVYCVDWCVQAGATRLYVSRGQYPNWKMIRSPKAGPAHLPTPTAISRAIEIARLYNDAVALALRLGWRVDRRFGATLYLSKDAHRLEIYPLPSERTVCVWSSKFGRWRSHWVDRVKKAALGMLEELLV